jgi:Tol biopolymer transport system component
VGLGATLASPEPTDGPPTATPFTGLVVTLDPSAVPLPPTFTPEPTSTPLPTATLTATPLPLAIYRVMRSDFPPNSPFARLILSAGDGSDENALSDDVDEAAYDSANDRVAFVRLGAQTPPEGDADEPAEGERVPQIWIADLDDLGSAQQVTFLAASDVAHPSWSPDGEQIVFSATVEDRERLYLLEVSSGEVTPLLQDDARSLHPTWIYDGDAILYASDADSPGFLELYVYDVATRRTTRLTDHPGNSYDPALSPDGQFIAYVNDSGGDPDIFYMTSSGQRPVRLIIDDGAVDRAPAWSPDGRFIAFASNRDGDRFQWYRVDLDQQVVQMIETQDEAQSLVFLPAE